MFLNCSGCSLMAGWLSWLLGCFGWLCPITEMKQTPHPVSTWLVCGLSDVPSWRLAVRLAASYRRISWLAGCMQARMLLGSKALKRQSNMPRGWRKYVRWLAARRIERRNENARRRRRASSHPAAGGENGGGAGCIWRKLSALAAHAAGAALRNAVRRKHAG